jgi:hypothetical protein
MKAFISYNSQQLKAAEGIKRFLKAIEIESFVANDDLRTSSDWKTVITKELHKCELFIPLLSKAFKTSDWCSQELGIACI